MRADYANDYNNLSAKYNLPSQADINAHSAQVLVEIAQSNTEQSTIEVQNPIADNQQHNNNDNFVSFDNKNVMHIEGISSQTFEDVARQTVGNDPAAVKDLSLLMYYDAILQDVTHQAENGVVLTEEQAPQIAGLQALHDKVYNISEKFYTYLSLNQVKQQILIVL